jgi:hypothetical protein
MVTMESIKIEKILLQTLDKFSFNIYFLWLVNHPFRFRV